MVCFSLGSNMGDRASYLKKALLLLSENMGEMTAASSVYETEPWGVSKHENYLNMVAVYDTALSPGEVLKTTSLIEKQLGRVRKSKKTEPRTLDIDILFYDSLIINKPNIVIPHPRITQRKFVLQPLAEIMKDFVHPVCGSTIGELFLHCTDNSEVVKTKINIFLH